MRRQVTARPDRWNYAGQGCSDGWECFFEPLSECEEGDVWQPYSADIRRDVHFDYRGYLYQVDTAEERTLHFANVDGPWLSILNDPSLRDFVPPGFEHRGRLWWRAQLAHFVFRPKKARAPAQAALRLPYAAPLTARESRACCGLSSSARRRSVGRQPG